MLEKLYQRMINHKIMVSSLSEIFEDLNKFLADGSYMRSKKMSRSLPLQVLRDRRNRGTVIQNFEDLAMFSFREYLLLEINPESRVAVVNMVSFKICNAFMFYLTRFTFLCFRLWKNARALRLTAIY